MWEDNSYNKFTRELLIGFNALKRARSKSMVHDYILNLLYAAVKQGANCPISIFISHLCMILSVTILNRTSDVYNDLNYVNGTIIIATDDADINTVLSGVFALNGFKVFKTSTAEEALRVFEEHIDKVDSMLINGQIAEDSSGRLIIKAKKKNPSVKIVVIANNQDIRTRVLQYGADEFTLKPMSAEMLTNKMLTLLASNRIMQ
jgi:CheY-like chemotaxis protein